MPPLPLGEGAKREPDRAKPQEKGEGFKIRRNLGPSPGAPARWLSRRPLPEGEGNPVLLNRDLLYVPQRAGSLIQDVIGLRMHRVNEAAGLAAAQTGLRPAE